MSNYPPRNASVFLQKPESSHIAFDHMGRIYQFPIVVLNRYIIGQKLFTGCHGVIFECMDE